MKRIFSVLLVVMLGAMGPDTTAEMSDESNPKTLADSIVVTANRVGMVARESVWPVKVIKMSTAASDGSLATALDGQSGLDVRDQAGFGSLSTLSNWGLFARHILLVYNGRVVKDYSLGGFNLADFSGSEIERIEILKGPQSAFYGADAVGGVVNLITPSSLANRVNLTFKRGTFGFEQYNLRLSRRLGPVGVAGHAEYARSDNHRHNAGSERTSFTLRSDYLSPDGRHQLSASARYFNDSVGVPGPQPAPEYIPVYGDDESYSLYDHQKDENYSGDLQYRFSDKELGNLQLDLFWEKKNLDYNSLYNYQYSYVEESVVATDSIDVLSRSVYNKRSAGVSGRYIKNFDSFQIAGGIDYLSGSVRATTYDVSSATNIEGPYAPYEYSYDAYNYWQGKQNQFDIWSNPILRLSPELRLDLSGRMQFVRGRTAQPSYNTGIVYSPCDCWQAKIGYAYAFRLPTIAEQFAEDVFTAGNEDLKPETSRSIIATFDMYLPEYGLSTNATVFHQTVDSLIRYALDWGTFLYVPQNVDRFRTSGVDLSIEYAWRPELSLGWSAVWQKAEQTIESGGDFVDAFYVPDFKWRLNLNGRRNRVSYGVNLNYTSDRSIMLGDDTKIISSVYELGAFAGVQITSGLKLSAAGYDLTDEKRPDQFGFSMLDRDYPSPGRRFVVSMSYGL